LDLEAAVADCAADVHRYGVRTVTGDRYAGAWVEEAFRRHGITYEAAAQPKSELYLGLLPLVTAGVLEVPGDVELIRQLKLLERRRGAGGRDAVDHPAGAHDDRANAVALATAPLVGQAPLSGSLAEYVVLGPPRAAVREFGTGRAGEEELSLLSRRGPAPWDL
jgi:hypothetical protein